LCNQESRLQGYPELAFVVTQRSVSVLAGLLGHPLSVGLFWIKKIVHDIHLWLVLQLTVRKGAISVLSKLLRFARPELLAALFDSEEGDFAGLWRACVFVTHWMG
jgi:hypothetical protein